MATNLVFNSIAPEALKDDNYSSWSACVKNYLIGQDLWDIIEIVSSSENTATTNFWKKKNAMALHAIQISCGPDMLSKIREFKIAKVAWDTLATIHKLQTQTQRVGGPEISSVSKYAGYWALLKDVEYNHFDSVKSFLDDNRNAVEKTITYGGKTALHVAVTAGHVEIVKYLVQLMTGTQLEIRDGDGYTALSAAASIGILEMAECIYNKNNSLIRIQTRAKKIPIVVASSKGHEAMVDYLCTVTPMNELIGDNKARGATLLSNCIDGKKFDVVLRMLRRHPDLAFARDLDGSSPVFRLSQMPSSFHSKHRLLFWQRLIYSCFQVTHREIWGQAGQDGQAGREIQEPNQGEIRGQAGREIPEPNQGQTGPVNVFKEVLSQLHWLLSSLLKLLGFGFIYKRKLMNVQVVELVRCITDKIPEILLGNLKPDNELFYDAIFEAVRHGNVEFITEIIRANLDIVWFTDFDDRDIFMWAVLYRQEKIFNLLHGLKARKELLTTKKDRFKNNMLHLAGMSPSHQLDHISGAAFQMQRELQWFEEVTSIVNPTCKESLNEDGKRPHELFEENHKNMMKEGQEWMKNNARSCSVVAALMVTIMFAVAFTVPGGESDETGLPIFLKKTLFKVFIVCDAISFFSSAASTTIFLGILTSRYTEKAFLKSLPKKMIAGQITLFISFVTMMVTFSSALILTLRGESLWLPILIIVCASFPILLFVFSQFPLLFEIISSTYGPSIFNRNTKPWLTK